MLQRYGEGGGLAGESKAATQLRFVYMNNWHHFNLQVHFMLLSSKFGVKIPRNDWLPIRELLAWKGILFHCYPDKYQKV